MTSSKLKVATRLIGKGGVGLVAFHLARLGFEFAETSVDSDQGDIWIRLRDGRILAAEVKATFGAQWPIKPGQIEAADLFFFVEMTSGRVNVATKAQLRSVLAASRQSVHRTHSVTCGQLRRHGIDINWDALGCTSIQVAVEKPPRKTPVRPRTVSRVLADGTMRQYTYPKPSAGAETFPLYPPGSRN